MRAARLLYSNKALTVCAIVFVIIAALLAYFLMRPPGQASSYAAPESCATCHRQIAETYSQTGMGRSFHRANSSEQAGFTTNNRFEHQLSGKTYQMTSRNGELFMQRITGDPQSAYEERVDYVVGSGNHARTYLHRTADGKLIELPVSWYTELGGQWQMSPGYDQKTQVDFQRAIGKDCMFCHNGYPSSDPIAANLSDGAVFAANLPEGIDCQRCHGPGAAHVKAAKSWWPNAEKVKASIVNPSHLPRERSLDVCRQCHLETTSLSLPNSIRRYGREVYSFKPGESLADYEVTFDRKPDKAFDDRFEVAHQAYRLEKSQCFLKSDMTCTTCHNPHKIDRGEVATKRYNAVCEGCHRNQHPQVKSAAAITADSNCLTCHMWKRRTDDVVHVVMTDHYIQRFKPATDMLAPLKEELPGYHDEVVPYYPRLLSTLPEGDLYTAVAQVSGDSDSSANLASLEEVLKQRRPSQAGFYFALATAYVRAGNDSGAVPWFEEALKQPGHSPATQRELAISLARTQQLSRAIQVAEQATATMPNDATAFTNLGNLYLRAGRISEAQQALQRALTINPEVADANNTLGLTYEQSHRPLEAQQCFRKALQLNPDHEEATINLATSLADQGDTAQANALMQRAISANPQSAAVRRSYAMIFAANRQYDAATRQMNEAIKLQPASTNLIVDLADLLIAGSHFDAAQQQYRRAIQVDPKQPKAHIGLASLYMAQNKLAQAEQEYESVIAADPSNGEAHLALADLAIRRNSPTEAKQHLQLAAQSNDAAARDTANKLLHR